MEECFRRQPEDAACCCCFQHKQKQHENQPAEDCTGKHAQQQCAGKNQEVFTKDHPAHMMFLQPQHAVEAEFLFTVFKQKAVNVKHKNYHNHAHDDSANGKDIPYALSAGYIGNAVRIQKGNDQEIDGSHDRGGGEKRNVQSLVALDVADGEPEEKASTQCPYLPRTRPTGWILFAQRIHCCCLRPGRSGKTVDRP